MSNFELKKACSFCHSVGIPQFGPAAFRRCSSCRLAYYCSEDCQRKHWRASHKQVHQTNIREDHQQGYLNPDSLQMAQPNGGEWHPVDFPLEYRSVREAIQSLVLLSLNLNNKGIFTFDESFKHMIHGLTNDLRNICTKLVSAGELKWRQVSNSLCTLEVLYHYPINSIFRFGSGISPWWESYVVCFGRARQAVDFLASLGDSGTFHNGNFPVVVLELVLPEAVVDIRGNPMLFVKEAQAKVVEVKDGMSCFNCGHQISGKLRAPFDPKDAANFHDEAVLYPLQRPVHLRKKKRAISSDEVQKQILCLGEGLPVFCNYACDMTLKIQEVEKMTDKPTFHVLAGPDILQIKISDTMSSMFIKILHSGISTYNEDLDGIKYTPSKRELNFCGEFNELTAKIRQLQEAESDDTAAWSEIILKLNKLRYQIGKYTITYMKRAVDLSLGQAYYYRGKIHHLKKSYLKAMQDFVRVTALFESKHDSTNTPPYKIINHLGLAKEGLESKCRLAEIYERLGNIKTALCEAYESMEYLQQLNDLGQNVEDMVKKVFFRLVEMPLVINVASLAKKKRDKAIGYFGCDWKPLTLKKVLDLNRRVTKFGETGCHTVTYWDNKLYILGGTSFYDAPPFFTANPRNSFWVVDLQSREMVQLAAPRKVVCRNSHSCVVYNGCLYVYGGSIPFCFDMTLEESKVTWKYCVASNKWSALRTKGDSPTVTGHGACVVSGKMFIFGGEPVPDFPSQSKCKKKSCLGCDLSEGTDLTDLYALDLETLVWSKLSGTGSLNPKLVGENGIPEGRQYPIMWADESSQRLFVLSGAGERAKVYPEGVIDRSHYEESNFHFKDFWQFSVTEGEWTKLNLNGNVPVARSETQAAAVKGGAVIFGGYTIAAKTIIDRKYYQNSQYLQDSFEFRYDKMAFRQIYTEHQPNPRAMLGLVADASRRDKVYLVGGRGNTGGFSKKDAGKGKVGGHHPLIPSVGPKCIIYGDIWQLDLSVGEAPGVNVEEERDEMFCKVCDASSSSTRLYQCSSCLSPTIRYCSKNCLTTDWPNHKKTCLQGKAEKERKQKEQDMVHKGEKQKEQDMVHKGEKQKEQDMVHKGEKQKEQDMVHKGEKQKEQSQLMKNKFAIDNVD